MNKLESKSLRHRYVILGVFIAAFVLLCIVRLFSLQIINGASYRESIINQTERSYPIRASRGEILDAYGRPMVSNRMGYYIRIQHMSADDAKLNETITILLGIMKENNSEFIDEFPINANNVFEFEGAENPEKKIKQWKKEHKK